MVWQIVNNVDTDKALSMPLFARTPFFEMQSIVGDFNPLDQPVMDKSAPDYEMMVEKIKLMNETARNSIQFTANIPSPRVIKTHLPLEMLPPKLLDTCKVIFVGRNPKDCCVSFYHHHQLFPDYKFNGTFEDFATMFLQDELEYGSYWDILKVCKTVSAQRALDMGQFSS